MCLCLLKVVTLYCLKKHWYVVNNEGLRAGPCGTPALHNSVLRCEFLLRDVSTSDSGTKHFCLHQDKSPIFRPFWTNVLIAINPVDLLFVVLSPWLCFRGRPSVQEDEHCRHPLSADSLRPSSQFWPTSGVFLSVSRSICKSYLCVCSCSCLYSPETSDWADHLWDTEECHQ